MGPNKTSTTARSGAEGTAERILAAATHLFATQGYEGTSTKQICETAGVNIAAIHYHFGSKEELLRTILEDFANTGLRFVQRLLQPPQNAEEFRIRLRMYVEEVIESYLQQPDVWKIVQIEGELLNARSEDVFRRTFLKKCEVLVDFISQARKRGIVARRVDPSFAARALFSQISYHTRLDHVLKRFQGVSLRDDEFRKKWIKQTLEIFIDGVSER